MTEHELANVDVGTYTEEQYYDDIGRLTEYRSDPDLTEILITPELRRRRVDARAWACVFSLGSDGRRSRWGENSSSGAASPVTSGAAARN